MKKIHKILLCSMIIVTLVSFLVLPSFAYGGDRDSYNSVITPYTLHTNIEWDVTFELEGSSIFGDSMNTSVNFKFDPVFPFIDPGRVGYSRTNDETESYVPMPNAGYDETLRFNLSTSYYYSNLPGFVDVGYSWSFYSSESSFHIIGAQFQAGQFYYTYDPSFETTLDISSPYGMYFEGASSVTTTVYYYELGNAIDLYSVSYTADGAESGFYPELFGYSEDEPFTVFIQSVLVNPHYEDLDVFSGGFDFEYSYDSAFCQFARQADLGLHVTPPSDAVFADYTSWIGLAVSGFLEFQIFPGFSFGALFMVIISFSTVIWFLKLFAGG